MESGARAGEQSRADVHRLRSEADAVVAGVGTVLADDPLLDVRPDPGHQPLRVVVDSRGRTPLTARALSGDRPAVVAVHQGVEDGTYPDQLTLPGDDEGRVELPALLDALQDRGVVSVLLEGGPTLAGAFVAQGLVDRVVGYVAPALLGAGPAALAGAGVAARSVRVLSGSLEDAFVALTDEAGGAADDDAAPDGALRGSRRTPRDTRQDTRQDSRTGATR